MTTEIATSSIAPANRVHSASDEDPEDIAYGWLMFCIFVAAVLAISFAVCVLAMAPSWGMLAVVYGTDLVVTAMVFKVVLGAFSSPAYADVESAKAASPEARSFP